MAAKKLTPKQMQLLVGGVVGLGASGFLYWKFFWSPMSSRIEQAKTQISDLRSKIDKATHEAARLPQIEKELVVLDQEATEAEKRLPRQKDLPAVIDTLSELASKHKITLQSFAPGAPAKKPLWLEVPYAVAARGSFHDIGRFFAALALEERIFSVRGVTFSGAGSAEGTLTVGFTLIAYQYNG